MKRITQMTTFISLLLIFAISSGLSAQELKKSFNEQFDVKSDAKVEILNKFGQVHDVDNVFVADGSLFVTGGGFNPVLTIMALGYWVGDYIVSNWNGSKFK